MNAVWIASMILQWAMILVLSLLVFSLMRQLGELTMRLNGGAKEPAETYALFSELPESKVPLVGGGTFQFGGAQTAPSLIVFFSPECSACALLPEAFREFTRKTSREELNLLVVIRTGRSVVQKYVEEQSLGAVSIAVEEDVPDRLKPGGSPFGVSITGSGLVAARGKPKNVDHLTQMARAAQHMVEMAPSHSSQTHEWGESAPFWALDGISSNAVKETDQVPA
jgi:hypothetical protein